MRDIKFRGKPLHDLLPQSDLVNIKQYMRGKFLVGSLITDCDGRTWIDVPYFGEIEVDANTVGQYTGLKDSDGNDIYEGDILQMPDRLVQVVWHEKAGCWDCNFITYTEVPDTDFSLKGLGKTSWWKMYKVVGNIYDDNF